MNSSTIDRDKLRKAIRHLGYEYAYEILDAAIDLRKPYGKHSPDYRQPWKWSSVSLARVRGSIICFGTRLGRRAPALEYGAWFPPLVDEDEHE